ncbi:PAS domain S-box protein [Spirosoma sp. BT702]|uniref:histidine kinase n=1 Tax=Spirosoma profusum TaxID=2771354 RepID=A0A926Y097_9BACT|nr:ATP-binding protein [Spirosoma profusum]MBD2704214.1 PAS domain S-box protein [Spirosoma profusum]
MNETQLPINLSRSASEESERLKLIIEAAQVGTWDFDPITSVLMWDSRCKALFGLPPDAKIDYDVFLSGLHPDDREITDQVVQEALRPGSTGRYDINYRTIGLEDHQLRWIRANGRAFFDETGRAHRFIGTVIDITESHRQQEELEKLIADRTEALQQAVQTSRQQEALARQRSKALEVVLESMPISMVMVSAIRSEDNEVLDFQILSASKLTVDLLGRSLDELIGQHLDKIYPDYQKTDLFGELVKTLETGTLFRTELAYSQNNIDKWFDVSAVKQDDGLIILQLDITDRKNANLQIQHQSEELRRSNTELRQSNDNLRQFAQIASHDLQEPLRKIQTFSDVLQNQFVDNLADGERDMVRRIQKSAQRMQMLVKDLLMYSQLATNRDVPVPVNLSSVITDVISDLEVAIAEKKAIIDIGALPTLPGSATRLRQLLQNLVANALKFGQTDSTPVITIRSKRAQSNELPESLQQRSNAFWLITVADNGIGFDEKYKDKIFHPFQRLHDAKSYGGTGIGLAICQRVAESYGGAIDVTSQPGVGSTFKVFLPVFESRNVVIS